MLAYDRWWRLSPRSLSDYHSVVCSSSQFQSHSIYITLSTIFILFSSPISLHFFYIMCSLASYSLSLPNLRHSLSLSLSLSLSPSLSLFLPISLSHSVCLSVTFLSVCPSPLPPPPPPFLSLSLSNLPPIFLSFPKQPGRCHNNDFQVKSLS